jgi:DNA-binding response OmpR family regulator
MVAAERSTRILIVDSDAQLRSRLAGYLEQSHMTVTAVANGDSMRAVLRHQTIDLLISKLICGTQTVHHCAACCG